MKDIEKKYGKNLRRKRKNNNNKSKHRKIEREKERESCKKHLASSFVTIDNTTKACSD